MIGSKVRLTDAELEWYLGHDCYLMHCVPGDVKLKHPAHILEYDNMIEVMLLMAMFPDEFPGRVTHHNGFLDTPAFRVDYTNYYQWHEPETLITGVKNELA